MLGARILWPAVMLGLALASGARAEDASPPVQPPPTAAPDKGAPRSPERMELDTTSIRGNQELPKVLYIVPWKEPEPALPDGRPLGSLVDEALAPVDREVFRRQMRYFDQLYARPADQGVGAPVPADD
jgi:hypothetical protein